VPHCHLSVPWSASPAGQHDSSVSDCAPVTNTFMSLTMQRLKLQHSETIRRQWLDHHEEFRRTSDWDIENVSHAVDST
jgi:hypothetical protein